ncbi:hypothetical protein BJV82DRAFT_609694 [Fennellomyces sp. T-0311]|nr:hypothetical protein BJV82DRAFT_609694 [Fennellomyces sp. T-0311]
MDILQSTVLTRLLSGDSEHTILLETAPPTKAKGIDDLRVFYFSTRKYAQVTNQSNWQDNSPPSSTVATITDHDEDYVDNEETTIPQTGITRDQIISEFEAGVRRFHRQEIEEAFKGAESKQKAVKMLEKLHQKHDKRKNIQAATLKRHPMDMAPTWFVNRIQYYKDYGGFHYLKSEGYGLHGDQESGQEVKNNDDQETDDEGSQAVENTDTSIRKTVTSTETMTFSLRSILREEIVYDGFLNRLENKKLRVSRYMAQLSNGASALTGMIASGRMARLCGTVVDDTIFDIQALVPGFSCGPEAKTAVHVSPVPPDLDNLKDAHVYQFEPFSNILSGYCKPPVSIT